MFSISRPYTLVGLACLASALTAVNAVAQEQTGEQRQSSQSEQTKSDQDQRDNSQQQNSDNQSQQDSSQPDSQDRQQAGQDEQRQQQDRERQQQQERERQQQRQRQQQAQQRDEQSPDRDQSFRDDSAARGDREWPQPNGRDYGSDSLNYGQQQDRSDQQGGLGVGLRSDGREGVVVSHIHPGSPADEMGIRQGDRITAVNGRDVQSVQQFIGRIRNMDPGQEIELDIRRARGGEQTVRGELESRGEALSDSGQQFGRYNQPGQRWSYDQGTRFGQGDRGNWQTSYDEERGSYSQNRSGQVSGDRLEQIERQVDRLGRELEELRVALQSARRQSGQPTQWDRERTAQYDEYQGPRRQSAGRFDGRETYRPEPREREYEREGARRDSGRSQSRDRFDDDSPGGETGGDRLNVGSEDIQDRN